VVSLSATSLTAWQYAKHLLLPVVVVSSPSPLSTPQLWPPLSLLGNNEHAEQSTFFFYPLALGSQATLVSMDSSAAVTSSLLVASGLGSQ